MTDGVERRRAARRPTVFFSALSSTNSDQFEGYLKLTRLRCVNETLEAVRSRCWFSEAGGRVLRIRMTRTRTSESCAYV